MLFKRIPKKNEEGSATIEFLGMVPFVFLLMVMLWQFFVAGFAVMTAQSAANEAAKVYSTTGSTGQAIHAARNVVGAAGGNISYDESSSDIATGNGASFTAKIGVDFDLVFLPDSWDLPDISIVRKSTSRVIR